MPRSWAPSKADENQREVVQALEGAGWSVYQAHAAGQGFPDLVVGAHGFTVLVEVKMPAGKLTPAQVVFHKEWRGSDIIVATTGHDAVESVMAQLDKMGAYR